MMDNNKLDRSRKVALKCALGAQLDPNIKAKLLAKYAKAMGYEVGNGGAVTDDKDNPVNVTDADLIAFAQERAEQQQTAASKANQFLETANSALFAGNSKVNNQSSRTQGLNSAYDTASDLVSMVNPIAGTVMKAGSFMSNALTAAGIGTDQMTATDQFMDSSFGKMTGLGIINAIGGSKTDDFSADQSTIERVGGSYGGTVSDINDAASKAGKTYGLFSSGSRKKANKLIADARNKQNIMTSIADEASDQQASVAAMGDIYSNAYAFQLQGGYDQRYMRAEEGGKLPRSKFEPEIIELDLGIDKIVPGVFAEGGIIDEIINPTAGQIEKWRPEIVDCFRPELVEAHKSGGRIEKTLDAPEIGETDQKNIIPEGALHKNKHHMDNAEDLTKKGIPVVDDDHNQQAEIERNEIIFTKEVTQKLEELYNVYYSDESNQKEKDAAAVDAGKLLTREIMLNTDDRTGLIDTLKDGGTIDQRKPAYNDWLNTINQDYLSDSYDLETAYSVLPFDVLERWRNETLKDKPSEDTGWHLPSVQQIDDDTIMFLKKGKTTKDNPELEGEFEYYRTDPEFSKTWKMVFNKDENRWYYVKRNDKK